MLVKGDILTDHLVDNPLYLTELLVADLLEMGEVEAQGIRRYKRALLLHMVAENLLQSVVEQVGSGMVGSRGVALFGIHTSHELG